MAAHIAVLPDVGVLHLHAQSSQRAFTGTVLNPEIQFAPIGYSQVGDGVDGIPAACVPRSDTQSGKSGPFVFSAEIVSDAAADRFFVGVVERRLLHIGVVRLGAERRVNLGLIARDRACDEHDPSGIDHLGLARGLKRMKSASGQQVGPYASLIDDVRAEDPIWFTLGRWKLYSAWTKPALMKSGT